MKCPHCNKEHLDNPKFCPETGKKMPILIIGCPNKECSKYGSIDNPAHHKFCPECGAKLVIEELQYDGTYTFNPHKIISTLEDFQHGNIIVDGIILGRSPASELKRFKKDWYNKTHPNYLLLEGYVHAEGKLSKEAIEEVLGYSDQIDSQLFLSLNDRVSNMYFYEWENVPFLKDMGLAEHYSWLGDEDEKNEIVQLFEKNGYVRIEPPVPNEGVEEENDSDSEGLLFISANPNAYGHYILIDCTPNGPLDINVNILREWTTYYDGIKHTL